MIQDADLKSKLILQADIFQHHYRKKEYVEAKLTRERAGIVAVFIRLPEKERTELFGDRQGDEPVEGLFDEKENFRRSRNVFLGNWQLRTTYYVCSDRILSAL